MPISGEGDKAQVFFPPKLRGHSGQFTNFKEKKKKFKSKELNFNLKWRAQFAYLKHFLLESASVFQLKPQIS